MRKNNGKDDGKGTWDEEAPLCSSILKTSIAVIKCKFCSGEPTKIKELEFIKL